MLDGDRSCPPEDCGGGTGYANVVDILLDPTHEDFSETREWAFNAEVFYVGRSMLGSAGAAPLLQRDDLTKAEIATFGSVRWRHRTATALDQILDATPTYRY